MKTLHKIVKANKNYLLNIGYGCLTKNQFRTVLRKLVESDLNL